MSMIETRYDMKKTKPKKAFWKWFFICLFILLSLILAYGAYVFIKVSGALDQSTVQLDREDNKSQLRDQAVTFSNDPVSILLMGIEDYSTNGKDGRADTLILTTLDPKTDEIHMVTIPRDTRIQLDNAGEFSGIRKINSAYTYGSITGYGDVKLQLESVEKLLNVPIDYYVAMNFNGFRDIVDALGGVTIDIEEPFWENNFYNNEIIEFEQGKQRLSGEEALAFVRMRNRPIAASYTREERQGQFLKATIDQAISAGTLFKVGKITDVLGENIQANLSANEILALQKKYTESDGFSIQFLEIKGEDKRIDKSIYFVPEEDSLKAVSDELRQLLDLNTSSVFTTNADYGR